ncbi:hypothetical protein GLOTRDRAFT_133227 [Gloeophyllum trabeum ATCC 11539]|uniref:Uncharacterized protein n=1 Tax=Gloeophyllum trabeum (strain ATCC 11539 / FP-39264 / Madison 617) TaxID=670483 RepID=S7PV30_GLOTA|nr:uncharacterized protein GLOTRDRAFT_133227 [Gloeophyllum trabeum ATCC 11539]EPQ51358.1 hypothetical protein GLOTRDRAFT_133227 [Gloeophyllum trabeum ATCC 11539]
MQMRVHAMYGNSRTILTLFVIMTVGEVSFWIVFLALGGYDGMTARYGNAGTNNPSPGLYFCADGDFAHKHWYAYFDTPILIIEITLVVLALYKAWQQHRGGNPNRLMMMLARESILYFVVVCAIYAVDQVLNFMNRMTLDELVNGYRNAIPVILANRLMISVRVAYYDHDYVDFDVSSRCTLSISNFRHEHGGARPSSAAFELKRRK